MVMIMYRGISSAPDSESHEELLDEAVENPSAAQTRAPMGTQSKAIKDAGSLKTKKRAYAAIAMMMSKLPTIRICRAPSLIFAIRFWKSMDWRHFESNILCRDKSEADAATATAPLGRLVALICLSGTRRKLCGQRPILLIGLY